MSKLTITALAAGIAQILIYGDINERYWSDDVDIDAKLIIDQLDAITEPNIEVRIKSNGGSLIEGIAIRNAFARKQANITFYIDSLVASAATIIPMIAGTKTIMASNALFMIHAPSTGMGGNSEDHRTTADLLDKFAEAWAVNIAEKTGKPQAEIEALLKDGKDHYFTAQEALDFGFVDEIGVSVPVIASALPKDLQHLPTAWLQANKLSIAATANQQPIPTPKKETPMPEKFEAQADDITAVAKEAERQNGIKAIFAHVPVTDKATHALMPTLLIDAKIDIEAARAKILAKMGENQEPAAQSHHVVLGSEGRERFIADGVNAILAKAGLEKITANNTLRGKPLERLAEECLIQAALATPNDRMGMIAAAFTQSTSDFPILLESAIHKTLLSSYAVAPDTWSRFCATGTVSDFKANARYRTGSFGNLDSLTELGEFKNKSIPDGEKASITIGTKGNIINISRQAIINDDLSAFIGLARDLARAAKRTIEADVYALLASNPTMNDGVSLFHATHGNLGTASAVTMAAVEEARQLMASQKDVGGNDFLDLRPALWLGGMAQGGNARVVNTAVYDPDTANKLQRPNLVTGLYRDVIDTPRITGNPWYTFADPMDAPVIEVAFLDGQSEPYIEMQNGWNVDGAAYKVRLDYGVAAIDYRGAVKNVGA